MPSLSPSPAKRPSMSERTGSNVSLSSSSKQPVHKVHRPRAHGRNLSHGKNLSKLGRINSSTNVVAEAARSHQRKKSGPSSPPTSPRIPLIKRNSSHTTLPKNTSQANLRKNKSATTLARNTSHNALKKLGLPPAPKQKEKTTNEFGFELGDSSEEEDAEWEDSTVSPEITRNNSKASTPARVATPNVEHSIKIPQDHRFAIQEKTSSPPAASIRKNNRSVPNFKSTDIFPRPPDPSQNPTLLQSNGRSSRAPPAMSSISAHAKRGNLQRSSSSRSFTHIDHSDVEPESAAPGDHSLSADGGVSHFLSNSGTSNTVKPAGDNASDSDSPSNFLPNYHPQESQSPEKGAAAKKSKTALPSRTQQRQELQRREMMRSGAMTPTTPPSATVAFGFGSAVQLHGRSGSRGRNRSLAEDVKLIRLNYEAATKQLSVVRRFRDPTLESLRRMKDARTLPSDIGVVAAGTSKSRPQSRRGQNSPSVNGGTAKSSTGTSPEDSKVSRTLSKASTATTASGRPGRVHFQRQGSHDDIGLSRSRGSYEDGEGELQDGMTEEEALVRRIWESRQTPVYEGVGVR